jgi:hypothetical protein
MAAAEKPATRKPARGRVQFETRADGKTLAVHLDRAGFRRLLETLERLAETGVPQRLEKSGRVRPGAKNGAAGKERAIAELMFHIDSDG